MPSNNESDLKWIRFATLLLVGLFIFVSFVGVSQADILDSQVGILNNAPTIDSIFFDSQQTFQTDNDGVLELDGVVTLYSGADTILNVSGVVSDSNGANDIDNVKLVFYSPEAVDQNCSAHGNNCYIINTCSTQSNDEDSLTYNCQINIAFWANSTLLGGKDAGGDWTAWLEVQDDHGETTTVTDVIDIGTLLSLHMPGPIDWGTLALGHQTTSTDNVDQLITQKGNDKADVNVWGTNMSCTGAGIIPTGNIEWDLNDDGYAAGGTSLTEIPDAIDITIPYQTSASSITDTIHWDIELPDVGVSGTCTGIITMTAVASAD